MAIRNETLNYRVSNFYWGALSKEIAQKNLDLSKGKAVDFLTVAPFVEPNTFERLLPEGSRIAITDGPPVAPFGIFQATKLFQIPAGAKASFTSRVTNTVDTPQDPYPVLLTLTFQVDSAPAIGSNPNLTINFNGPTLVGDVSLDIAPTIAPTFNANVLIETDLSVAQQLEGPPLATFAQPPSIPVAPEGRPALSPTPPTASLLSQILPNPNNPISSLLDSLDEVSHPDPPAFPPRGSLPIGSPLDSALFVHPSLTPPSPLFVPPPVPIGPPPVFISPEPIGDPPPLPVPVVDPPINLDPDPPTPDLPPPIVTPLQLPEAGRLRVTLFVATAALRSEVWLVEPFVKKLIHDNRKEVGTVVTEVIPKGAVPVFEARVFGDVPGWDIPNDPGKDHKAYRSNDPASARIEQLSPTSWKVGIEDLPPDSPRNDFDFDDIGLLVELDPVASVPEEMAVL